MAYRERSGFKYATDQIASDTRQHIDESHSQPAEWRRRKRGEDVVELERESVPYSGLNLPHDGEFEERDEDPVNDALVQEDGRHKPHPLLWAESRSRPGQLTDVVETLCAHLTAQQLCQLTNTYC